MDLMARAHLRHISRAKLCMALVAMLACLVSVMNHYYSTMVLTRVTEVTNWFFQCAILSPLLEKHVSC
jgi:RsiW-degrading membrane proteinase PrsW (M82 family)